MSIVSWTSIVYYIVRHMQPRENTRNKHSKEYIEMQLSGSRWKKKNIMWGKNEPGFYIPRETESWLLSLFVCFDFYMWVIYTEYIKYRVDCSNE